MWFNRDMDIHESKTVAELNVGDHIVIIDETVKVVTIRPDYLNGRTYVMFEYIELDNLYGSFFRKPTSWLLFKPTDTVERGFVTKRESLWEATMRDTANQYDPPGS